MSVIVAFLDYGGILRTIHDPLLSSGAFLFDSFKRITGGQNGYLFLDTIYPQCKHGAPALHITSGTIPCTPYK